MKKQPPITPELLERLKFRSTSRAAWGETFVYEVDERLQVTVWISRDQTQVEVILVLVGTGARELTGMNAEKLKHLILAIESAA